MADDQIKKLEKELKEAFKDGLFTEAKGVVEKIKQVDPENHLADTIAKKIEQKEMENLKKEKAEHLKKLEAEMKDVIRAKSFDKVPGLITEIRKIDPNNGVAKKAEKMALENKIKIKTDELKNLMEVKNWELAKAKSNELLELQWGQSAATKALKTIAKEKKVDWNSLITVTKPESKPGFFAKLFGKKETVIEKKEAQIESKGMNGIKMSVEKPAAVIKLNGDSANPVAAPIAKAENPPQAEPTPTAAPIAAPAVGLNTGNETKPLAEEVKKAGQGNIFTNLFGKKEPAEEKGIKQAGQSIMDAIVAKKQTEKPVEKAAAKNKDETGESFLKYSMATLRFSMAFIILTAGFFYSYNIDEENKILSLVGQENYASQLKAASNALDSKKQEEININKDIQKFQQGYQNTHQTRIDKIIENRLDWADLISKLNEVTESVYEKNSLAQYVQYNNYSYDVDSGRLSLSATLSDPLGKNLTKLAELEQAFMYYPKDKNDPNSEVAPYFYDLQEFQSYSKSFNKETGRFTSNFSLSLSTKKGGENQN